MNPPIPNGSAINTYADSLPSAAECLHLAPDLVALTDGVADAVQDLGQVAADLAG